MNEQLPAVSNKSSGTGDQKGFLTLPFNEDQFKDFIVGLLGTPQTITKRVSGVFDLNIKDIQGFHDLILQRVGQQNEFKLLQMQAQIYYNDESSVLLSSYEELLTYNEIKPVVSQGIKMTWSLLIKFADKSVPEKQEIEVSIFASSLPNVIEDDFYSPGPIWLREGKFKIQIKHTARSWGSDIESLLTNQINSLLLNQSKWRSYFRKHSGVLGILSGLSFFLIVSYGIYVANRNYIASQLERSQGYISTPVLDVEKLNFFINLLASNTQSVLFFNSLCFMVISIFVAILLGTWITGQAANSPISYLTLTRESTKYRGESITRAKQRTLVFLLTLALNFILSIAASSVFVYLAG